MTFAAELILAELEKPLTREQLFRQFPEIDVRRAMVELLAERAVVRCLGEQREMWGKPRRDVFMRRRRGQTLRQIEAGIRSRFRS